MVDSSFSFFGLWKQEGGESKGGKEEEEEVVGGFDDEEAVREEETNEAAAAAAAASSEEMEANIQSILERIQRFTHQVFLNISFTSSLSSFYSSSYYF